MESNSKLPEGFSYDELVRALLERFKPYLQEIIREELTALNNDLQPEKKQVAGKSAMTALEPEVADNGRYSLTETCKILELSKTTMIRHTKNNAIKFGIRKSNGRRFYTGTDIKKFWRAQY